MSDPKITCHRIPSHEQWPYPYRFDIEGVGTGFHGVGRTPAEALLNAAAAWRRFETAEAEKHPTTP